MRRALGLFSLLLACDHPSAAPIRKDTAAAPQLSAPAPSVTERETAVVADAAAPEPAVVEKIAVRKDSQASVVRGNKTHIAFMPGLCSNAHAYMLGFPEAARAHGGVVAIEGDQPCEGAPGFHSFTWSAPLQRARIEAAFAAAEIPIPEEGLTLVGYSAGASIAELMHQRWPALFPKLVLIAPPMAPKTERLRKAHAVVAMSCSLDVPYLMKAAVQSLAAIDVPATYLEMPKCTHGNLADGERVFGEAFDWLDGRP